MRSIAFWAGWLLVFSLIGVSFDLSNQRDRANAGLQAIRIQLRDARAQIAIYQRAALIAQTQTRQLADQAPPPCPPCPTLGERIRSIWGGSASE